VLYLCECARPRLILCEFPQVCIRLRQLLRDNLHEIWSVLSTCARVRFEECAQQANLLKPSCKQAFPRLAVVAYFPALGNRCTFFHAWQWLNSFPHLALDARFCSLSSDWFIAILCLLWLVSYDCSLEFL